MFYSRLHQVLTFFLTLDRNRLGGKAVEDEGLSISMYTGQEDEIEMIDPPIDARSATWATTPSRRFAW
jgi:hypothetical protein